MTDHDINALPTLRCARAAARRFYQDPGRDTQEPQGMCQDAVK